MSRHCHPGMVYTAVAAGAGPSLALRSNGQVIAFGRTDAGQARVPPLGLFSGTSPLPADSDTRWRSNSPTSARFPIP